MTAVRSRSGSFKIVATMGMVLLMAFFSACDILATEGAREAIANGREIREFEDENIRPLEDKMGTLWTDEIQPRESELEDLRRKQQTLQEDVIAPLWEAQNDIWAPGGSAAIAQALFSDQMREIDLLDRANQVAQNELDARWQVIWDGNNSDPEYQALDELRQEKQRELDRIYRFGYRPIDDIWDQINEINSNQGSSNTDSQIESELLNIKLRELYDFQATLQNGGNDEANELFNKANGIQDQLNNVLNFGRDPINAIHDEINRLEIEQSNSSADSAASITAQIFELETVKASYLANRDAEVASYQAQINAISTTTTTVNTTVSSARIAELVGLITDVESQIAAHNTTSAAIAALEVQIDDKKASYNQLIDDAVAVFETNSAALLAQAEELDDQIDDLEAVGGDDAAAQIAILQPQYDALIALEQAEEDDLHTQKEQLEAERDAGVLQFEFDIDALQVLTTSGSTDSLQTQLDAYNAELVALQAASVEVSDSPSAADLQASIVASENHWNTLIAEIAAKISVLENELIVGSSSDDAVDARINNLRLQAADLEIALSTEISNLEALVKELYRQAEAAQSGDSEQMAGIQAQIDELNRQLEAIWQGDSAGQLDVLRQVQELERQARVLEEENEQATRRLEEEVWDLDDKLNQYWKDSEADRQALQTILEGESAAIRLRQTENQEQRWVYEEEQRVAIEAAELEQVAAYEAIRLIEEDEFGALKLQMRTLEDELRAFYDEQRTLEGAIRIAQGEVEQLKRELEDKVFDALESAAGTVDEAGDAVLTATEEAPEIDEGDEIPEETPIATPVTPASTSTTSTTGN
jgi:hypothetical protein